MRKEQEEKLTKELEMKLAFYGSRKDYDDWINHIDLGVYEIIKPLLSHLCGYDSGHLDQGAYDRIMDIVVDGLGL